MTFLILTFIGGCLMVITPLALTRNILKKWHLPASIFWKAGLAHLAVAFLYLAVTANISIMPPFSSDALLKDALPILKDQPLLIKALVLGLISGLFIELGRFVVLDRFMKKIRSFQSGIFFGVSWAGLQMAALGIFMVLSVFSINSLLSLKSGDLANVFPDADKDQLALIQETRDKTLELVNGNPGKAMIPIIENINFMLVDIALTLLILSGITKGLSRFTWAAVGLRTLISAGVFYLGTMEWIWAEVFITACGLIAFAFIRLRKKI